MPRVFISYRREDSQDVTGRIYDHLAQVFPPHDLFRDIDSISAGIDFRRTLEDAVGKCDLMLVVIGPRWASVADTQGRRRLESTNDFVRIEVEAALKRGVPVIPVTVSHAAIPTEADLPASLRELSFRNGRQVRPDPDFRNDIARLIRDIQAFDTNVPSAVAAPVPGDAAPSPTPRLRTKPAAIAAGALAAVVLALGVILLRRPAPSASPGTAGQRPKGSPIAVDWVVIPGGRFMMGSDDGDPGEKPRHSVDVKTFRLAKTEVTVAQYRACVAAGACAMPGTGAACNWGVDGREDHPINCVAWEQAKQFADWAGGRLPSEAEWEYAARSGGKDRKYPWGAEEASCERAVVDPLVTVIEHGTTTSKKVNGCGRDSTWPVCSKPLGNTEQGLCDMGGNVSEWIQDWVHPSYDGAPTDGSAWEEPPTYFRALRGSSWGHEAADTRSARRVKPAPGATQELRAGFNGLRLAKSGP